MTTLMCQHAFTLTQIKALAVCYGNVFGMVQGLEAVIMQHLEVH